MKFWESSVDFNSARKVLVIPNITNSKNLEKDSFVDVLYNHIRELNNEGNFFWYVIVPEPIVKLNLDNVKQLQADISGDMIKMRTSMPIEVVKYLENIEYDTVYSHLPDWSAVARYTDKPVIGYAHWWEMKTCNAEDRKNHARNLIHELIGALRMKTCFLNTQEQKDRVMEEAKEWLSEEKCNELESKLCVWNLGVAEENIIKEITEEKENIIVFNHRAAAYKGYPQFIQLMKEYRETRQDFKVWVPQLEETPTESWIDNTKLPKGEYYKQLQKCRVGIQMRQTNYGWSVAATDCMMNGTPVIYQDSKCFHEIDPNGMFFTYKKQLFSLLDYLLNDDKWYQVKVVQSINRCYELERGNKEMIKKLANSLLFD